jgi:hypothetical protein
MKFLIITSECGNMYIAQNPAIIKNNILRVTDLMMIQAPYLNSKRYNFRKTVLMPVLDNCINSMKISHHNT